MNNSTIETSKVLLKDTPGGVEATFELYDVTVGVEDGPRGETDVRVRMTKPLVTRLNVHDHLGRQLQITFEPGKVPLVVLDDNSVWTNDPA